MMAPAPVNLKQHPLQGPSLIEASAGTGKTFTITHLYLRFLLETDIQVQQLLVVTFTNAATQELKGRIRELIYQVWDYLHYGKTEEGILQELFTEFKNDQDALFKLQRAMVNFDEAAIFSIHGFCQRILNTFPLETGSILQQEIIHQEKDLQQRFMRDYWRLHIVNKPVDQLQWLLQQWPHPERLLSDISILIHIETHEAMLTVESIKNIEMQLQKLWHQLCSEWSASSEVISEVVGNNPVLNKRSYNPQTVRNLLDEVEILFNEPLPYRLPQKWVLLTQQKLQNSLNKNKQDERLDWPFFNLSQQLELVHAQWVKQLRLSIMFDAAEFVRGKVNALKIQQQNLSFDDLIDQVAARVNTANSNLIEKINSQYPVAMVDEFQDTDYKQYGIFKSLYQDQPEKALIMIGDPKQAIYSFRGADVFTYQQARDATSRQFTLQTNYRSTADYIDVINRLFSYQENAFLFTQLIQYQHALPNKEKPKKLTQNGQDADALIGMIYPYTEKAINKGNAIDAMANACADEIKTLLGEKSLLLNDKEVVASDLAVLVKTGYQATVIKSKLAQRGIASAMIQRDSVFASNQAMDISQLLSALIEPSDTRLLSGLLTSDLFGWSSSGIFQLQQDDKTQVELLETTKQYQLHWQQKGILSMFFCLLDEQQTLHKNTHFYDSERRLTNWLHIIELLQQQAEVHSSQSQVLQWLNQQINEAANGVEYEEHQLRLESDSELVRIVTIHKSKGLQYPIVFLPFMWHMRSDKKPASYSYHDEKGNKRFMIEDDSRLERWQQETLAEEIRLFYVAMTRAQYRCYLGFGHIREAEHSAPGHILYQGNLKNKTAEDFYQPLQAINMQIREIDTAVQTADETVVVTPDENQVEVKKFDRTIEQQWRISSYSQIASSGDSQVMLQAADYDGLLQSSENAKSQDVIAMDKASLNRFTFTKGARAGNCLHDMLELLDFEQPADANIIRNKIQQYAYEEAWVDPVTDWMNEILRTELDDFRLSNITLPQRISEMEFYMTSGGLKQDKLNSLLHQHEYLAPDDRYSFSSIQGFLTGFIDLVFEYKGQYFIADYKSNFLGSDFDDYDKQACRQAMYQHHYHLQYLIYTLALHRYLRQKMPDYDYIQDFGGVYYLFIRGMSPSHKGQGIYFDKPDINVIDQLDRLFD